MLTYSVEDQHTSAVIGVDVRADALVDVSPIRNSFQATMDMLANASPRQNTRTSNTSGEKDGRSHSKMVVTVGNQAQKSMIECFVRLSGSRRCSVVSVRRGTRKGRADLGMVVLLPFRTGTLPGEK